MYYPYLVRKLFIIWISIPITFLISSAVHAGEDRGLESTRLEIIRLLDQTLIRNNVCQTVNDCTQKSVLFVSPVGDGLTVTIYGRVPNAALGEVVAAVAEVVVKTPIIPKITIEALYKSKRETLRLRFWQTSPRYFEATLYGDTNGNR